MAQHEHNPFEAQSEGWREQNVYQDLGHRVVETAMNIKNGQNDSNVSATKVLHTKKQDKPTEPTRFYPDQFKAYP